MIAKVKEVLRWLASDKQSSSDLRKHGLNLALVGEAVRYAIHDFDPRRVGFAKFAEVLQFTCKDAGLRVGRLPNGTVVLQPRSASPSGIEVLPDFGGEWLHSADHYRSVLSCGAPIFRLPQRDQLVERLVVAVLGWLLFKTRSLAARSVLGPAAPDPEISGESCSRPFARDVI